MDNTESVEAIDRDEEETVSPWLAGAVLLAIIVVMVLAGAIIKSLYVEQPTARTAVERDIFKYKALVEKDPKDLEARIGLVDAYLASKKIDEAEKALSVGLKQDPKRPEPHMRMAEIYRQKGRVDLTISEYEKAIELDTDNHVAYYQLGQVYLGREDYKKAADAYKMVVKINPTLGDAHYYLGYACEKLGERDEARRHYGEALKFIPDYPEAKDGYARVSQ